MSNLGLGQCQVDNINQMKTLIMIKLSGLVDSHRQEGEGWALMILKVKRVKNDEGLVEAVMKSERPSRIFTIYCSFILKSSLFFSVINSVR
jgi:hypothetical protein